MADEGADIDRFLQSCEPPQERRERHRGTAVRPLDRGRYALAHQVIGSGQPKNAYTPMIVDVDEAWSHNLRADIDDTHSRIGDRWRDASNGVTTDRDVPAVSWSAAAIDDAGIAQHEIVGRRLRMGRMRQGRAEQNCGCE